MGFQMEALKRTPRLFSAFSFPSKVFVPQRKNTYDSNLPFYGQKNVWFRFLLVRHGEALSNEDKSLLKVRADASIPLSLKGKQQAKDVGQVIRKFYENDPSKGKYKYRRLWSSPYLRARETADIIMEEAGDLINDRREHILLGEQQFGLFEGHTLAEIRAMYPLEFDHFTKCIQSEGRFWARMPLGESRFDVAKRVHQAFGTFHRDSVDHDIRDLIIVSHGVTLRALAMMWLHRSPEWFEKETNPNLCSVRCLADNEDQGYLFSGFQGPDRVNDRSEWRVENK